MLTGNIKTLFLLSGLTIFFMFIGGLLGGTHGMIIALVFSLGMNLFAYFNSDKMVLKHYDAQEVTDESSRLYTIVKKLSVATNMPMPKVYVINDPAPNAFATGRSPSHAAVAATTGILDILSDDELEGVMAHELGHVHNRDILISTITASMAGAIMMLAQMFQMNALFGSLFGGNNEEEGEGGSNLIVGLLLAIIAPIAASLIQMSISRSREFMADEAGARISGKPWALANALRKIKKYVEDQANRPLEQASESTAHLMIYNPFAGVKFSQLFSTHPDTEERISRLEHMKV